MKTKRLLQLLLTLALLCTPTIASASGVVHQALAGATIDPSATVLHVVPPKGGMVILYRNGKALGWWMQEGYVKVKPNRTYGVAATRGMNMMFNTPIVLRRGVTDMIWRNGNRPAVSYTPSYAYDRGLHDNGYDRFDRDNRHHDSHAHNGHDCHDQGHNGGQDHHVDIAGSGQSTYSKKKKGLLPAANHRTLLHKMDAKQGDWSKLAVLKRYTKKYRFSRLQRKSALKRFQTKSVRRSATANMASDSNARLKLKRFKPNKLAKSFKPDAKSKRPSKRVTRKPTFKFKRLPRRSSN